MPAEYTPSNRNKIKRIPKRGQYDKTTIYEILDQDFVCHLGFVVDGQPFVIPTAYGRDGDTIYLHGATTSRMLVALQEGIPVCMTVTLVDGIVLARSAFHHSMNYRSVVAFGTAKLVEDEKEKDKALFIVSEQILKGRWDESRLPNAKELKATAVLALKIEEASAKIRTGPPGDDKPDYELPIWAGVIPIEKTYLPPIPDPKLQEGIPLAKSTFNVSNRGVATPVDLGLPKPIIEKEYAPFYNTYVKLVPDGNIIEIIKNQGHSLSHFYENIPAERWDYRYAPGKWSIKEVLLHIIDTERVMAYRLLRIGRGDKTPLPGFDQDIFANSAKVDHRTKASLVEEYRQVRQATIHLLSGLTAEDFGQIGMASDSPISALALAYIIAGHELHHQRVLVERY